MTNRVHVIAALLLVACAGVASRAPLGGNYALPESAPAVDRDARLAASSSARPDVVSAPAPTPPVASAGASAAPVVAVTSSVAPVADMDTIHFEPLQVGSRVKAEVTLSGMGELRGELAGAHGKLKLALDTRERVEIKVLKASAQGLDELELVLTTLATHTEFGDQVDDGKQEAPQKFYITLSGAAPTLREARGYPINSEWRLKLSLFIVPLAEFYGHWARSPTFELKPGSSSKVPLPFAATFFATGNETMRAGPLDARFTSRDPSPGDVPFELALPVEYTTGLGKVAVDLTGSAKLNAKSGRPSEFDLSGPLSATGEPRGPSMSISGTARLAATLVYP